MNAGLAALAEATTRSEHGQEAWDAAMTMLPLNRAVDPDALTAAMRQAGLHLPKGEWTAILRTVGVLDARGWFSSEAAAAVSAALPLMTSTTTGDVTSAWSLVVTLPPSMEPSVDGPGSTPETEAAIVGLLDSARRAVVMTAPFTDAAAAARLAEAILDCGRRGVDVSMMTSPGRGTAFDKVAARWPRAALAGAEFRCLEGGSVAGGGIGSHAKVCLVDGVRAYIGSANLTAAGLGRQFEVGALVEGGQVERLAVLLDELACSRQIVAKAIGTRIAEKT